jgi:hypothetical protein
VSLSRELGVEKVASRVLLAVRAEDVPDIAFLIEYSLRDERVELGIFSQIPLVCHKGELVPNLLTTREALRP